MSIENPRERRRRIEWWQNGGREQVEKPSSLAPVAGSAPMIACAGDGAAVPRSDTRMVWLKIPGTVNRYKGPAVPLCSSCRKAMRSQWKYAHE